MLSKQIWESKSGAKKLFATNSAIRNGYSEFVKLAKGSLSLIWEAKRNGEKVSFKVSGEDFLQYETKVEGTKTNVIVKQAYKKSEISNLNIESTKGYGEKLKIKIADKAMLTELIKTSVKLQFVYKPRLLGWRVVYDKTVPADALELTAEGIVINVGKLGINPKFVKRKRKVRYTVWVGRSFGNNSTKIKLHQSKLKLY